MLEPVQNPHAPAAGITAGGGACLMLGVWERNRSSVAARVEVLEQAVRAIEARRLDNQLSREARRAAHTLAGSLGMFGFSDAAMAASELECFVSHHCAADPARARAAVDRLRADLAGSLPAL